MLTKKQGNIKGIDISFSKSKIMEIQFYIAPDISGTPLDKAGFYKTCFELNSTNLSQLIVPFLLQKSEINSNVKILIF